VIPSLETLDWSGFLARPQLPSAPPRALENLCRQSILITGAGGSIGSALALRLAPQAQRLVLLESSESHLFALQRQWSESATSPSATFLLGSIADTALLNEIFPIHAPRLVFHAAAFKHVPLMEEQPLAAVANNIYGTLSLVTAASAHRARVVLLSTDKAVEPASVMGATKRVAEQIVLAAGGIVLRLGNVLASRDSVAEVFARQIAAGAPLSITDPAARRYFLTLPEAVELLLSAAAEPDTPVLLAPDLPTPQYIADLARFMARTLAPDRELPINFTHPRAGDKESEQLWAFNEKPRPAHTNGLLLIDSPLLAAGQLRSLLANLRAALDAREISAALDCLCALVPDYTPSRTVLALRAGAATTSQARND
jgi:FlaA1/EpsC-like NDP-sugar epimerase